MDPLIGIILIVFPIILAFVLLVFLHKAADVTGVIVWLVTLAFAIFGFQTDVGAVSYTHLTLPTILRV